MQLWKSLSVFLNIPVKTTFFLGSLRTSQILIRLFSDVFQYWFWLPLSANIRLPLKTWNVPMYLVQHDRLHTVTEHRSKLSCNHWLAATLQRRKTNKPTNRKRPLREQLTPTICSLRDCVQIAPGTLAPIRHMSLVMCDCIISAMSCDWLAVLMNVWLLWDGRGALEPAGT